MKWIGLFLHDLGDESVFYQFKWGNGMQICQVVGYKNSGKTTVMRQLIHHFSLVNLKVGSLKHHGHGGEPDMLENTDSTKHLESGSLISGVQGASLTELTIREPIKLAELVGMYKWFQLDLLLIEGYKNADHPKFVLVKNSDDLSLLSELSNIIAVGLWDTDLSTMVDYPTFDVNNTQAELPRLVEYIRRC